MGKNKTDNLNQDSEAMLKEKTNQDFNKQKPNPNDLNQNKDHQSGETDGVEKQIKKVADKSDHLIKDSQSGVEVNEFSTSSDEIEKDSNESK